MLLIFWVQKYNFFCRKLADVTSRFTIVQNKIFFYYFASIFRLDFYLYRFFLRYGEAQRAVALFATIPQAGLWGVSAIIANAYIF